MQLLSKLRAAQRRIPITNADCDEWARSLDPESRRTCEGLAIALFGGLGMFAVVVLIAMALS